MLLEPTNNILLTLIEKRNKKFKMLVNILNILSSIENDKKTCVEKVKCLQLFVFVLKQNKKIST